MLGSVPCGQSGIDVNPEVADELGVEVDMVKVGEGVATEVEVGVGPGLDEGIVVEVGPPVGLGFCG